MQLTRRTHSPSWTTNDWRLGAPPRAVDDVSDATLRATVVIPCRGNETRLESVLVALSGQTYPLDQLHVVVVDDASDTPLDPRVPPGLEIDVVRPWERSRGAGAARAEGANHHRSADVLLYLDADMLPEHGWVNAHLRWHEVRDDAAVIGFRRHVERTTVARSDVEAAASVPDLFRHEEFVAPTWFENGWTAHQDGLREPHELWRLVSSGNMSTALTVHERSGGFDASYWTEWGGEDNEFGHRLYTSGALLIPERQAMAWHLGLGTSHDPAVAETRLRSRHRLALRVPSSLLPRPRGLIPEVPTYRLQLRLRSRTALEASELIDGLLAEMGSQLAIELHPTDGFDDADFLGLLTARDSRVRWAGELDEATPHWPNALVTAWMDSAHWSSDAAARALRSIGEDRCADLDIISGSALVGQAWLTRARNISVDRALQIRQQGARRVSAIGEWSNDS